MYFNDSFSSFVISLPPFCFQRSFTFRNVTCSISAKVRRDNPQFSKNSSASFRKLLGFLEDFMDCALTTSLPDLLTGELVPGLSERLFRFSRLFRTPDMDTFPFFGFRMSSLFFMKSSNPL